MLKRLKVYISSDSIRTACIDVVLVAISYYLSYLARFGGDIPQKYLEFFLNSLPMVLLIKIYFIYDFRLYRGEWKYTSIHEVIALFKATFVSSMAIVITIWLSGLIEKLPRTVIVLDWSFSIILLGGVRILPRLLNEGLSEPVWRYLYYFLKYRNFRRLEEENNRTNVLVYGAGGAGEIIVRDMRSNIQYGYIPIGFIDDNPSKKGKIIHGVEVLGDRSDLERVVENKQVDQIIISLATAHGKDLREVIDLCEKTGKKTKIVPPISEIVDEKISISNIRNIEIEDLLGREPVNLDTTSISEYLRNKRVLVTGAGGSIGSELCRQIMKFEPKILILFGRGENSIFQIHNELRLKYPDDDFPQVIGDVINRTKVEKIFDAYRPEIVFHAGADKHVPLMELNPDEAVLNNIVGTQNVIDVSDKYGVKKVICISTDKAVNPSSMMGACKRVGEMLVQSRKGGKTKAIGVRFGNVLGSRGSVIPLFERQIREGGPVTVTHKEMKRFLMTIPEAAQLVVQAGAIGENGDLFVLDMGEDVSIDELARRMIRLAGFEPEKEIEIVYTGVRPGEKLYEELVRSSERQIKSKYSKIIKIVNEAKEKPLENLLDDIMDLRRLAIDMDYDGIYEKLSEIIPEYEFEKEDQGPLGVSRFASLD